MSYNYTLSITLRFENEQDAQAAQEKILETNFPGLVGIDEGPWIAEWYEK